MELVANHSPSTNKNILDYGAGDGSLTLMLADIYPDNGYSLFEPTEELRAQATSRIPTTCNISVHAEIQSVQANSFNIIMCMEVLEHLPDEALSVALEQFSRLLVADGRLIISVPIETGFSSLFKNLVRLAVGQTHESSSIKNFTLSTFGLTGKITRVSRNGYIDSHIGFDYRSLESRLLKAGWQIDRCVYSPIPWLHSLFNSQVFYLLRPS